MAEGQFNETAVWVNREGQWKVLLGHDDDTTLPEEAGGSGQAKGDSAGCSLP